MKYLRRRLQRNAALFNLPSRCPICLLRERFVVHPPACCRTTPFFCHYERARFARTLARSLPRLFAGSFARSLSAQDRDMTLMFPNEEIILVSGMRKRIKSESRWGRAQAVFLLGVFSVIGRRGVERFFFRSPFFCLHPPPPPHCF